MPRFPLLYDIYSSECAFNAKLLIIVSCHVKYDLHIGYTESGKRTVASSAIKI